MAGKCGSWQNPGQQLPHRSGRREPRPYALGGTRWFQMVHAPAVEFSMPFYTRIDAHASHEQKSRLKKLSPDAVTATDLAGEPITAKLTRAPGNDSPIWGVKGRFSQRLVRCSPLRHRANLQTVRPKASKVTTILLPS
jgi:hypothetical protein